MNKRHEMPPIGCQFVDRFGVDQHGTLQGIGGFCHPASVMSKAQIKSTGYAHFCVIDNGRTTWKIK
jgi:hypothetical protein